MRQGYLLKILDKLTGRKNQTKEIGRAGEKNFGSRPLDMAISLTTRCNFNCPHCLRIGVDENKKIFKDLPLSIFKVILREGKKRHFKYISFTGGEPILHPQFAQIIAAAAEENYKFSIVSNGWLYKEYFPVIEKHRPFLRWMVLSLDGLEAEIHDKLRNKPGSFARLIEALKFFKEKKVPVTINWCATKDNLDQLEELPEFCLDNNVFSARISTIIPPYGPKSEHTFAGAFSNDERDQVFEKILSIQKKYKNHFSILPNASFLSFPKKGKASENNSYMCPARSKAIYIDHGGAMIFCCNIYHEPKDRPLIQELGFDRTHQITRDSAQTIKDIFLNYISQGPETNSRVCDFCDKNIDLCIKAARQELKGG